MDHGNGVHSLYYAIVGHSTNTNEGLVRLLALIAVAIVALGTLFWALLR